LRLEATARARVALLAGLVALPAATALPAEGPWSASQADVRVLCPLTVGGSFEARTTSLAGAVTVAVPHPAAFVGDLTVDLRTLDTGIGMRNDHMREQYLEVEKGDGFDKAVLSDVHLGEVDAETFQGRTTFTGTLRLHGTTRRITGAADVRRAGSSVRVEAAFPVTLADFGIPKPQYLGVGVKGEVQVKVSFTATPGGANGGGSR
jgi:polyisoprenoid-binding protein YceI